MPLPLEFTGERYVPGTEGEIAQEHWHRYLFARRFVVGKRVLDAACGEGYGTALLSETAADVVGVDIDGRTIEHARERYGGRSNARFVQGSVTTLPLADASVDVIVSFETIEHLQRTDQPRMIDEFARVLAKDGIVIVSSPNRVEYSEARHYSNPFHFGELDRDELDRLLHGVLPAKRWYRQRRYLASALWAEMNGGMFESWAADYDGASATKAPAAMYFVVIAARDDRTLPQSQLALSLCSDRDERELKRIDDQAREVLRLDALLKDRDAALDRQTHHVHHLEQLVAERDRIVGERDRQLSAAQADITRLGGELERETAHGREAIAAYTAECQRLERVINAQERIINYRQSARWWVALPWLRVRLLWKRLARG